MALAQADGKTTEADGIAGSQNTEALVTGQTEMDGGDVPCSVAVKHGDFRKKRFA